MKPLRPIGHIAAHMDYLALTIVYRLRLATPGQTYLSWVDDDGCVYLAPANHRRAAAVRRSAPEQRINSYRKPTAAPFPLGAADVKCDLLEARAAFARRSVEQGQLQALTA